MSVGSLRRSFPADFTVNTQTLRPTFLVAAAMVACSASSAIAQPVQWPISAGGNDRYYEVVVVDQPNITWSAARDAASLRSFGGLFGQLVTPTTPSEELFIRALASSTSGAFLSASQGFSGPWIGALQLPGSPGTDDGPWTWTSGEAWGFTNWFPGEPNNGNGGVPSEEVIHLYTLDNPHSVNSIQWNDLSLVNAFYPVGSYIVEYSVVPSPTAAALLGLGGLIAARRRR